MILTSDEIEKEVINKRIHIKEFDKTNLNPNSYNYHLDNKLLEIIDFPIDPKVKSNCKTINLDENGYVLSPHKLYLGSTREEIGSDYYVTSLIGRSSLGRLGLFLQITADLGNLGAKHCWTLELKVVQPLRIYPLMKIGQVMFWCVDGNRNQLYKGKYEKHSTAHCSEIYKENFEKSII